MSFSTFSDVKKLCDFRDIYDATNAWNRWIIVIGFERQQETEYPLDTLFPDLFNFVSTNILNLPYVEFISVSNSIGERHLVHQVLKLYAFKY